MHTNSNQELSPPIETCFATTVLRKSRRPSCHTDTYRHLTLDHEENSSTGKSIIVGYRPLITDTDIAKRPSVKTSRRGRTATGDTSSTKINGNHDVLKDKPSAIEDSSGDDQDEADSEAEEPTPTKAVQPLSDESDQSAEPRKTRPAQKARSSKRLTRNAEVEADEESPGPGTPPSTRPRRARASGKNYNMLAKPEDFEESADEPRVVDPLKSPKKSRIVALRVAAGVPKKATPDARSPRAKNPKNMIPEIQTPPPRKTRRAASANNDHEAASTVASNEEISPKRMSTRLKEANEGNPAPDEDLVDQLRRNSGPGKRRRHVPSKLNLEQELLSKAPSAKTSRKRKLSEAEASETLATPATADSAAQTTDDDEKQEPRRRVAKHKEHLGFLPNGQPRKRRRRVSDSIPLILSIGSLSAADKTADRD